MKTLLYANTDTLQALDAVDGSAWIPPEMTYGHDLSISLRFARSISRIAREYYPELVEVRASIGEADALPKFGRFSVRVGTAPNTETASGIRFPVTADELQADLEALTAIVGIHGSPAVEARGESFVVVWGSGASYPVMETVANTLEPFSLVRYEPFELSGVWHTEILFTRTPVVFTDGWERILPPQPEISRIQAGGSDAGIVWNEIQQLLVPSAFRGTYQLKRDFARTEILSQSDGPEEVQAALDAIVEDGFLVTLPENERAHIEFAGEELAGQAHDLLEVTVTSNPPGDATVEMTLESPGLRALLRDRQEVELMLDVEMDVEDENDSEIVRTLPVFRIPIVVRRPINGAIFGLPSEIDWLRPRSIRDYVPFSLDQVLTGQQTGIASVIGDGVATQFTIDHSFDSEVVAVQVRENTTPGAMLVLGTDFSVDILSPNSTRITVLTGAPDTNSLVASLFAVGPASVFQNHTHTIGQIDGLALVLDGLDSRLTDVETLLPTVNPGTSADDTPDPIDMSIPPVLEIYPGRFPATFALDADLATLDPKSLPRAPGLLPAIHDATAASVPVPLDAAADHAGEVFVNDTASELLVPGGLGRRSERVPVGAWLGSDGRVWYRVVQEGATTTWHPYAFERELFLFHVSGDMLRVGRTLEVVTALETRLFSTDKEKRTRAQWVALIEVGTMTSESSPATTGRNIKSISWEATPSAILPFILSDVLQKHTLGIRIARSVSELTCDGMLYGYWTGGATAPPGADFAVRARLCRFDTEDGLSDPRGFVGLSMPSSDGGTSADGTTYATIT